MKISIRTEKVGARIYIVGNTWSLRDELRAAGCHWDAERRQWWIGTARADRIKTLVEENEGREVAFDVDQARVYGKVAYQVENGKKRTWYVIGISRKTGIARLHLAALDGKVSFWIDEAHCEWIKQYGPGRRGRLHTLKEMREFVESIRNEPPEEREKREARRWAYENFGGVCRCAKPLDEGDGECMHCGYGIIRVR